MTLIIDVRRSLPWRRRVASDLATAGIWMSWLVICAPWLVAGRASASPVPSKIAMDVAVNAQAVSPLVAIAAGIAAAMWVLPKFARKAASKTHAATPDYAAAFEVKPAELDAGRASQICVLRHDAQGRIIGIETPAPLPPVVGGDAGLALAA